jgi:hypothetical protein
LVEKTLKKKLIIIILSVLTLLVLFNLSFTSANDVLEVKEKTGKVVEKIQGETFTVEIDFKNIGKNDGTWNINIVFEGDYWSQEGVAQNIELKPNEEKKLTWTSNVPNNAPINTLARLVVYYEDSFIALNWWILVTPDAELAITSSCLK